MNVIIFKKLMILCLLKNYNKHCAADFSMAAFPIKADTALGWAGIYSADCRLMSSLFAADIVKLIRVKRQSAALTWAELSKGIPESWQKQRMLFGA